MKLKFKKLYDGAKLPSYAKDGDAGMDLTCTKTLYREDEEGNPLFIEYLTGLAVEIPEGHVGLLFPRSSVTKKKLVLKNSVGVIDSGYRGEIMIRFDVRKTKNFLHQENPQYFYDDGDKVAQLIVVPIPKMEPEFVEELSSTERGEGGFGSTGK